MISGGIFGPKLSGKTTLAVALSREYWNKQRIRSLVLDPNLETWGPQAYVTGDEGVFWPNVWKTSHSLVIVEEAAETIRREKELIPVFTRLRHCHHKLLVIGHSGVNLLPIMREQLDTLFLFRQPASAAKIWAETMTDDGLLDSVNLRQYEFLHCALYRGCKKLKLPKP